MKKSAGSLIVRMQVLVQRWGWSLAMSAVLEMRDEQDRFVVSGSVPAIAKVVFQEARYRAHGGA